ncbi:GNAT family N-acetyltransferase [Paludibacterium yongneupense]|uniref:GNAT family N-acetyltransferase n=1 Tax=Paludibacterium yongneupense TaxID=400061 RepID=UPI000413D200|nr:GNAT family N-acetyltransferase [Paludibacterium yongneupense]
MTLDREDAVATSVLADFTCRPARPDDFASVVRLYEEWGYGGRVEADDVMTVLEAGARVIGVVRLACDHDCTVLRGMYICPAWRGRGLGRQLLLQAVAGVSRDIYCLPYAHLEAFYRQAGFEICSEGEAPAFLRERVAAYRWTGKSYLIMHRVGSRH